MLGIVIGLAYGSLFEWAWHRYVFHGLGRDRKNFWSYHWHEHHRNARRHDMMDPDYERSVFGWHGQGKEALGLTALAAAHLPLLGVAPFFTATVCLGALHYYRVHRKAHQDPAWAREHVPWHVDHHLAPNQDANWGVTTPWVDIVLGTRAPYLGTDLEGRDARRRARRLAESGFTSPAEVG